MAATAPDTIVSLKSKDKVAVSDTDTVIGTETKTVMGLINTDIYFLLFLLQGQFSVNRVPAVLGQGLSNLVVLIQEERSD